MAKKGKGKKKAAKERQVQITLFHIVHSDTKAEAIDRRRGGW